MRSEGSLRAVWRDGRQREVRVVLAALIVAVSTVATITLFAGHLQRVLVTSASSYLAADWQLQDETGDPIPAEWIEEAARRDVSTAEMIGFSTMVYGGERFQLVQVKAVSDDYPLRGSVEWQADADAPREDLLHGPPRGDIWINARLLRLLDVSIGDSLEVGRARLRVGGVLVREPDAGFRMAALAPRVLMHVDDVPATDVLQPGSRVDRIALFAGDEGDVAGFRAWVGERKTSTQRWTGARNGQTLSDSLERAERFLLLGGSLAVLLAAVAVAVASRQYALGQRDAVALLKTLGLRGARINRIHLTRLLTWGAIGTVGGLVLALPVFYGLADFANRSLDRQVPIRFEPEALWPALMTALLSLFAFAYPPIRRLRNVPAMRVLRSQPGERGEGLWIDGLIALVAIFGLLFFYARRVDLVLSLLGAVAALIVVLGLVGWVLVWALRHVRGGASSWRLAFVTLYRHRQATLSQLAVFAMTLMLAATLFLVRSSLLEDWRAQLPEDTPNHFLINIAPDDVDDVHDFLASNGLEESLLFPMVRGRLIEVNGTALIDWVGRERGTSTFERELNLTWKDRMQVGNAVVRGEWWNEGNTDGVSVGLNLSSRLGLSLGDTLTFAVGADRVSAPITSFREIRWDSMRPNFNMVFAPDGPLDGLPATYITSFKLEGSDKAVLNEFTRRFPTVSVLEVDDVIEGIQEIISQVTRAIEAILALVLVAAVVVMVAVVGATLPDRQKEGALLRTLGGRQTLLARSTVLEFAVLGLVSGVLAVIAAEVALYALQSRAFQGTFRWHWDVTAVLPLVSATMLALFGRLQLTPVLRVSPMLMLRRLEG